MNTYLFIWNPQRWDWYYIEESIKEVRQTGKTEERWSCGNTKSIRAGDRFFLMKLGTEPKGIIAAGYVKSNIFLAKHWSGSNKEMNCVLLDFDVLLNPDKEPILSLETLNAGGLVKQMWTPQASGISIRPELVYELEAVW